MSLRRIRARELAREYVAKDDATGWFEPLYAEARGDAEIVPWADMRPNPNLVSWLEQYPLAKGNSALVVGCGLGDDAEYLEARGLRVTAFDISATAIAWCHRRFPHSRVAYRIHDLFQPIHWSGAFDFVLEAYTLQVLPQAVRSHAMQRMVECVSPRGMLLVISRGREPSEGEGQMPWPLTRRELSAFEQPGLVCERFEDYLDKEDPPVRRFRVAYRKTGP